MELPQVPVAVLTGFLGAGKTTLLNILLRDPGMAAAAVVINEFGAVGIDHLLVERIEGDLLVLAGGCLCCAARGDFLAALRGLRDRRAAGQAAFDRIVVETTGVADPGPILNTAQLDPDLWPFCRLDTLVTLVDAAAGMAVLDRFPEAARQVAMADRIVLTKTDLPNFPPERRRDLEAGLRSLNGDAPILDVADARAAGSRLFEPVRAGTGRRPARGAHAAPAGHPHAHLGSCVLRAGMIDADRLHRFLSLARDRFGAGLLRLKGLASLTEAPGRPVVVQMVGHMLHPASRLAAWPDGDRETRLVAITEGVAPGALQDLWEAFFAGPAVDRPDAAALIDADERGAGLFW